MDLCYCCYLVYKKRKVNKFSKKELLIEVVFIKITYKGQFKKTF